MATMSKSMETILKANQDFYDAFANGDFGKIKQLWSSSEHVSVIHPGSVAIHGQNAVMFSWELIFENSTKHQIQCDDAKVFLLNESSAYVTCKEVFLEGQLLATNIFSFENEQWLMVHHQAGPLSSASVSDNDKLTNPDSGMSGNDVLH